MLCDDLEGGLRGGSGREPQKGGDIICLWLIDIVKKPIQHCKAIILQFKKKEKKFPLPLLKNGALQSRVLIVFPTYLQDPRP